VFKKKGSPFMKHRRGKGNFSTLHAVAGLVFLIGVVVAMAILLTPEKEEAPPVSTTTYEARPADRQHDDLRLRRFAHEGEASVPEGEDPALVPVSNNTPPEAPAPAGKFSIEGTALDKTSGEPVSDVAVIASRVPTEAEESAYQARDREVVSENRTEEFTALIDEKQRLWADASVHTGPDGRFVLPIEHEGEYRITLRPRNHLRKVVEKEFVGESRPRWTMDVTLETGASISGRITDSFDNKGVAGITVYATLEPNQQQNQARTDDEGNYTVGGLSPGNYGVVAEIENTVYRVTKVLPFKRTSIAAADQAVKGIDFKLDKGGVVWGYVKTPDDVPVAADVVLCTSESVLTQALTAMVKRAPPLRDNADKEDGYYELTGVPLDEEWRVYATADESAPQLADPFVLTSRAKEVRVDITMFAGSNVFGQVVDGKGKPVPDAQVACFPSYTQLMSPMDKPQAAREGRSDDEGYFEIKELPAGNYQIMGHKEGYKYALNGTPIYSNGYHEVKNVRVVLENIEAGEYRVFGTVMDATGSGLSGAKVTLSGIGTESLNGVERETESGPGGDFNFDGVEIGTYVIHADLEGYARKTLSKVLLDKQNDVVMEAASIVRGRVIAKSTNAAPENGYTVSANLIQSETVDESDSNGFLSFLQGAESGNNSETFNDPTGTYELTLSAGTWQLEGSATPLAPARRQITLEPGQVLENIDLILDADGGTIEGVVLTTDGQSPQGATVFLVEASSPSQALTMFAQDGGGMDSMQVGDDGVFTFERLGEGTYYAVARHPAYPQAMSPSILLEAQGTQSGVEIIMGPGGSLEGFVFEEGRGVEGRVVTVVADGQPYTGTSGANGAYAIRNIPAGTWQAFVTNPGAGISLDMLNGQGYPVTIFSGSATYRNFGEFTGVTLNVTVASGTTGSTLPGFENIGGRVVLNPATVIPVIGSGLDVGMIPGDHYTVISGAVSITDVTVGPWRVDYYSPTQDTTYRWRGTADVEVTGEALEIEVVIFTD
jgi:hypothetical protein